MRKNFILTISAIFFVFTVSNSQTIRPAKPTHLMYTPTPFVNPAYHLVIGLHEISFALPANLQLQASLLDNIGRIIFGAKYGLADNMAIGAGMAYSFYHIGDGVHGVPHYANPRLGVFFTAGLIGSRSSAFQLNITPHTQIGDFFSAGVDLGLMSTPHPMWSIIWEVGSSVTNYADGQFYLNTDVGIRINPPKAKFLFFDFGIDLTEFAVGQSKPSVSPYIDFTFAMNTK
ncbi:MAG TPA: hypothetical protein VHP36_01045 [Chitinispirillaceae bacterium]|nr:hypothetical protein [Chitinispirillaceae bacterium]